MRAALWAAFVFLTGAIRKMARTYELCTFLESNLPEPRCSNRVVRLLRQGRKTMVSNDLPEGPKQPWLMMLAQIAAIIGVFISAGILYIQYQNANVNLGGKEPQEITGSTRR